MTILQVIAKHFRCEEIFVSRFGVREGYLVEKLLACRIVISIQNGKTPWMQVPGSAFPS
jgi:hypothetical protein